MDTLRSSYQGITASRRGQLGLLLLTAVLVAALAASVAARGAVAQTSGASTMGGGLKEAADVKIIYVGCNAPTTFFWARVTRGAQEAANNLGIQYQYLYPQASGASADITGLNQTVEQAIAAQPDGIAVCGLDPNASRSVIQRAVDSGIAVVLTPPENTITQSPLRDQSLPYIGQVGADEPSGGILAANSAISRLGSKSIVCTQSQADTTQGVRCRNLVNTANLQGVEAQIQIVPNDIGQSADIMTNYLRAHPEVDTVVTTNADVAMGVVEAKNQSGRPEVNLVTFDLNSNVLNGIRSGAINYGIDQQQYWRGYMPVLLLTHYVRYKLVMANNFLSGPNIIDQSNVDAVIDLVDQAIR
jgi:simple sugar transport system substrate-binding protein